MALSNEQLTARRQAARSRTAGRRRRTALACVALLAFPVGVAAGLHDGGSGEDEAGAPIPLASPLSDRQLVGQRLIAGFSGTDVPRGLGRMIGRGRLAGVILFEGNVGGAGATRRLTSRLQRIDRPDGLGMPLAVMVDQEGGLVERLDGPPSRSAEQMGDAGRAEARRQGRATARNLRRHGINVDLAPVLDVGRRGGAIETEGRSFGRTPARVIETGVDGFAAGLRDGGVATTAKHFPGLGAASVNTDASAQTIRVSRARLRSLDEAPFSAFSEAGGELVMLGLATYPALSNRPAAFSRKVATGELRRRVGFDGVSVTDSLDAVAATSFGSRERVALAAAGAGSDLLLYGDWRTARAVSGPLGRALGSGDLERESFVDSVERVLRMRSALEG